MAWRGRRGGSELEKDCELSLDKDVRSDRCCVCVVIATCAGWGGDVMRASEPASQRGAIGASDSRGEQRDASGFWS